MKTTIASLPGIIRKNWITILIFTFIAVGVITRNIIWSETPFLDWDESIYAQVAREVDLTQGIGLTYNGGDWLEKPPLYFILLKTIFLIFGESEFWARMGNATLALAMFFLLTQLTRSVMSSLLEKTWKNESQTTKTIASLIPSVVLFTSFIFLDRTSTVNTDTLLVFAILLFFVVKERPVGKAATLFVGVMTKSLLGLYPLAVEVLSVRKKDLSKRYLTALLTALGLCAAWYLVMLLQHRGEFVQIHLLDHLVKRFTVPIELKDGGKLFYVKWLWKDFGPTLLVIAAGYAAIAWNVLPFVLGKKWAVREDRRWRNYLILFMPVVFLAALTLGKTKIGWYMLPAYPFIAISAAYLYLFLQNKILRALTVALVGGMFLWSFTQHTYLTKAEEINQSSRVALADCVLELDGENVGFLVDFRERDIKHVMEATQTNIETSFLYGGSPRFIYYSDKQITYSYDPEQFTEDIGTYDIVALANDDYKNMPELIARIGKEKPDCWIGPWVAFEME